MAKKFEVKWRKGRHPEELAVAVQENTSRIYKEAFLDDLKSTAGSPPQTWPVLTGKSRDAFHWSGDVLVSTDYAPRVNELYGGIVETKLSRFNERVWEQYWNEVIKATI